MTEPVHTCLKHRACTCGATQGCCFCEGHGDTAQAQAPDGLQLDLGVLEQD